VFLAILARFFSALSLCFPLPSVTVQVLGATITHRNELHKIYEQPLILTANELSRGIVSTGEEARMLRFVTKLLSGQFNHFANTYSQHTSPTCQLFSSLGSLNGIAHAQ